jgi:hypothetical protein
LQITGRLTSLQAPLSVEVLVEWQGLTEKKSETINFFLAKRIENEPTLVRLPIANSKGVKFIASAGSLDQTFTGDLFLTFERVKDVEGLLLKTWKRDQSAIVQSGSRQLPKLSGILGYYQADVNRDGVSDLLVLGQYQDGEELKLILYYLSEDLRPLIPNDGTLVLEEEPVFDYRKIANASETKWHYRRHAQLGTILLPAVVEKGYVPELDLSLQERRNRERQKNQGPFDPHLFYLEPIEANGTITLRSRIVDTEAFRNALRSQLNLRFYEDIEPRFSIPNGDFIFSAGQLGRARAVRIKYQESTGYFTPEALPWSQAYSGYRVVEFVGDGGTPPRLGLMGLLSKSRAHLVVFTDSKLQNEEMSLVVDIPDESEYLIRPLLLSVSRQGYRVVIETGQNLFGFVYNRQGELLSSHQNRLARSTFFNDLLTQVTWPVLTSSGEHQIYVDDTQINARFVWLKKFDVSNGFNTSSEFSFTFNGKCRTLNPARWAGEGFTRLQALCETDAGLELLSLPLGN